jgi:hypothetical protein
MDSGFTCFTAFQYADSGGDGDGQADLVLLEDLLNRHQRRLGVERVEDRFHQQEVGAAFDERADLLDVGLLHLIERHHAEARVIGVRRVRERDGQRPDGPGDEALFAVLVRDAVGPFTALARGGFVDLPSEVVEKWILDDLLVERRIFAPAMLARVVHEELALTNARGGEGVGLDDVRAGFEEAPVNVANHRWLRDREKIAVVLQIFPRILEAFAANVRLRPRRICAEGRAHRAVDDGDALLQQALQRRAWSGIDR